MSRSLVGIEWNGSDFSLGEMNQAKTAAESVPCWSCHQWIGIRFDVIAVAGDECHVSLHCSGCDVLRSLPGMVKIRNNVFLDE